MFSQEAFIIFFYLKTHWQKGTSENTLNTHIPELGHARRVLLILTLASCEAPRSGVITARSSQFWGIQQVPWHGSVPVLGQMCCLLLPREEGRGCRHCPCPATQTQARLGEPGLMLPTAYQGCLLTVHCLGGQYSAYGFVTTSLWVLSTSLALARPYGQKSVSQIEKLMWLSGKKSTLWEGTCIFTKEHLTWRTSQSRWGQGSLSSCASTREQHTMMDGWTGVRRKFGSGKNMPVAPKSGQVGTTIPRIYQSDWSGTKWVPGFLYFMSCSKYKFY